MQLTFVALVFDRPGVLNRVASLIRRRGLNIDSLSVGHSETPGTSRMTLVVDADPGASPRIEANLYKLVDIRRIDAVTDLAVVCRDLALIKVAAAAESRGEVMQLVEVFRGRVVDVSPDSLVVELTGSVDKVDGFVEALRPFGIVEVARTGRVVMTRGRGRAAAPRDAGANAATADDSIACSV